MDLVRSLFPATDRTGRIKYIRQEIVEESISGMRCARIYEFSEDTGAVNRGVAPFLLFENFALVCVHTLQADHVVGLWISQRYSPDETVTDVTGEANRFFRSLIATELPEAASEPATGVRSRD